jgi:SSS family solute:Na+ symporter
VGRLATFAGTAASIAAAYIVLSFDNLMDYMQLLGSMFISPFFVVFFLGMLSKRITPTAGFWGMVAGVTGCLSQYILYRMNVVHYSSSMAATLNLAIWGGGAGLITSVLLSFVTKPKPVEQLAGLVIEFANAEEEPVRWYYRPGLLAAGVGVLFFTLNFVFR